MQCKDNETFDFVFGDPIDAKGNPAAVQAGSVAFSVADPAVGRVVPSSNNPSPLAGRFIASAPSPLSPDQVTRVPTSIIISADGDTGAGVSTITGQLEVIVLPGNAVGFGPATVGAAVPQ